MNALCPWEGQGKYGKLETDGQTKQKCFKGSQIWNYSPVILTGESLYNTSQKGKHEDRTLII